MNKSTKLKLQNIQHLSRVMKAASTTPSKARRPTAKNPTTKATSAPQVREGSKLAEMITLLRRRDGATIDQMMKATGWQAHSVRGAMSGALKKKLGLTVTSAKVDGLRTYHITAKNAV